MLLMLAGVIALGLIAALVLNGGLLMPAQTPEPAQVPNPPVVNAPPAQPQQKAPAQPAPASAALVMKDQRIFALNGNLAFRGDVDLGPVFARIEKGVRDAHDNDGAVFGNFERRLPQKSDRQYYREYVIRTPNLREVGPQRLIIGKRGEAYYTPDHYENFVKVK